MLYHSAQAYFTGRVNEIVNKSNAIYKTTVIGGEVPTVKAIDYEGKEYDISAVYAQSYRDAKDASIVHLLITNKADQEVSFAINLNGRPISLIESRSIAAPNADASFKFDSFQDAQNVSFQNLSISQDFIQSEGLIALTPYSLTHVKLRLTKPTLVPISPLTQTVQLGQKNVQLSAAISA
jgi:alpha-L-arabinofuranosidase